MDEIDVNDGSNEVVNMQVDSDGQGAKNVWNLILFVWFRLGYMSFFVGKQWCWCCHSKFHTYSNGKWKQHEPNERSTTPNCTGCSIQNQRSSAVRNLFNKLATNLWKIGRLIQSSAKPTHFASASHKAKHIFDRTQKHLCVHSFHHIHIIAQSKVLFL